MAMQEDQLATLQHAGDIIGSNEHGLRGNVQDSWTDAEYFQFFHVCQVFVCFRKLTTAVRLRTYMTRWRFHCLQERKIREVPKENADMTSVQASRLSLVEAVAEHENLCDRLSAERKTFAEKMYQHTVLGGAKMFIIFWRCRLIRTLGIAFQKWLLEMKHYSDTKKMDALMIRLEKGADELNDRQAKTKEIEELNSRLQLSLLVVMSVLRLRTHSKLMNICSSLKNDAKMRKQLLNEVLHIKDALKRYGAADVLATTTALERGKECMESLKSTREHLQVAQEAQNKIELVSAEIKKIQRDLQNCKDIWDRSAGISSTGMGLGGGITATATLAGKSSTEQSNDMEPEESVEKSERRRSSHHRHTSHHNHLVASHRKHSRRGSGGSGSSSSMTPATAN